VWQCRSPQAASDTKVKKGGPKTVGGDGASHLPSTTNQVEIEIAQLKRRYGTEASPFSVKPTSGGVILSFTFFSTDPSFKYKLLKGLALEVLLPAKYPSASCTFKVVGDSVSEKLKNIIAIGLNKYAARCQGEVALRKVLRWLDRNLETLYNLESEGKTKGGGSSSSSSMSLSVSTDSSSWSSSSSSLTSSSESRSPTDTVMEEG